MRFNILFLSLKQKYTFTPLTILFHKFSSMIQTHEKTLTRISHNESENIVYLCSRNSKPNSISVHRYHKNKLNVEKFYSRPSKVINSLCKNRCFPVLSVNKYSEIEKQYNKVNRHS